ncbi:MAG: NAD(P)/FAD-dependent oxidoreductase [Puniceicoccales bacterium]|jgi:phytoene dehydrogenase-like protein|nr:NAD(P)/FAD-dependent oxidoreductase [Puniceicoccales bacterium]
MENKYSSIIIGAGMSGLAAGIRLAQYGKRVLILEKHHVVGGLNSFYNRLGRKFDVGLHAITNFVRQGIKQSPLNRLFRQLRITRELFDLYEQNVSRILIHGESLCFTNDFSFLEQQVAEHFPQRIDAFRNLVEHIRNDNSPTDKPSFLSARRILEERLQCPRLEDMLLMPIFFYGGSQEEDIDWCTFVILFRSIFLEGLARPFEGIRRILTTLTRRFMELGGERRMRCTVDKIDIRDQKAHGVFLHDGSYMSADHIISSIGHVETMKLCDAADTVSVQPGKLSFCDAIAVLKEEPRDLGWEDTIVFFEERERIQYRQPQGLLDTCSGTICIPNNYNYGLDRKLPDGILRISHTANTDQWKALLKENFQHYSRAKKEQALAMFEKAKSLMQSIYPASRAFSPHLLDLDFFTPHTIEHFTGHINGSIYGTPHKVRSGKLPFENLYLCGTDHGYSGIIGSMMSGIAIANSHILSPSHS